MVFSFTLWLFWWFTVFEILLLKLSCCQEKKKKLNNSDGCILKKNYDLHNEKIGELTSYDDEKFSKSNFDEEYKSMLRHIELSAEKRLTIHEKVHLCMI